MLNPNNPDQKTNKPPWWRRLSLDLRVFIHLFPWRIAGLFALAFTSMAFFFQHTYLFVYHVDKNAFSFIKSLYAILNMATFQISFTDIPPGPELDIFFVLVPLISIPLLLMFGVKLIQIIRVFFVRQERGQMWQFALAKTLPDPIVVCGLGRVGYRIASQLISKGYPVVGIEAIRSSLVDTLIDRDMPVILGDIRNIEVLRNAVVSDAKLVLVCTHDDLTNIMTANLVRELNPDAEIILRLFDDSIADEIQDTFMIKRIISRSAVAAQAFAFAAVGLEVLETFYVDGKDYVLAEIPLQFTQGDYRTLDEISLDSGMSIVCLYQDGKYSIEPSPDTVVHADDTLIIFAELSYLTQLKHQQDHIESYVIVCGIGHTGFRVVTVLADMEIRVCAVDFATSELTERLAKRNIKVVYGDYRQDPTLMAVDITNASALIACAEDDMINVETVIRASDLVPGLRVVARMFEETLGQRLQKAFNIAAVYSTSEIAAPEFVAAAVNLHLAQPVNLGNDNYLIARLMIHPQSPFINTPIHKINELEDTTVLLHCRANVINVPPDTSVRLKAGDEIVILTSRVELNQLSR
jgi:voltage-gated potassium channel